jgi:hypothetical protein
MVYKLIPSFPSFFQSRIPPDRADIGLHQVSRVTGDASVGDLGRALGNELAVGGATTGADPLGGGGGS